MPRGSYQTRNVVYAELENARSERDQAIRDRNKAYSERNLLVALISHIFRSYIAIDPDEEDPEWRYVIFIETPSGQLSWHVHSSELVMFSHLGIQENRWDKHTTVQKNERISNLGKLIEGLWETCQAKSK